MEDARKGYGGPPVREPETEEEALLLLASLGVAGVPRPGEEKS